MQQFTFFDVSKIISRLQTERRAWLQHHFFTHAYFNMNSSNESRKRTRENRNFSDNLKPMHKYTEWFTLKGFLLQVWIKHPFVGNDEGQSTIQTS